MVGRTLMAVAVLGVALPAGRQVTPTLIGLRGRLIANARPVDWLVEVRLDSQTTGRTLATAYTIGSEEFEFQDIGGVNPQDRFVLVIEADGYEPIRKVLDNGAFLPNPRFPNRLEFSDILVFHLKASTPAAGRVDQSSESQVVDLKQLTAEIPEEAFEEYASALEALEDGDDGAALDHLEAAIEVAPDYYDALNTVGIEYLKAGRYRDAEASLEHARTLGPSDPRPLENLGTLHFQEGQAADFDGRDENALASYGKAIDVLDEAVRLDPLAAETHFYLGSALYETGEYARAEPLLVRALDLDREQIDAHLTLVNVYTRLGRYAAALDEIREYLEAAPDSPQRQVLERVRTQIEAALAPGR